MNKAWLAGILMLSATASAEGRVTFLSGAGQRERSGERAALSAGSVLQAGDVVATGAGARLELTLADGSVVRLGPSTRLRLSGVGESFRGSLQEGQLWAKAVRAVEPRVFEVEVEHAVAQVRGTTFRVDAHRDRSALVRVYAGAVAVAAVNRLPRPATGQARHEITGPAEIDRKSYERLLARLMEVRVSAAGEVGEPRAFEADSDDGWAAWNRARDGD